MVKDYKVELRHTAGLYDVIKLSRFLLHHP